MHVIGVDIGGSGVRAGRVDEALAITKLARAEVDDREVAPVIEAVVQMVRAACGGDPVRAVGVGVPGFVREGVVLASPNFPAWQDVDLRTALMDRLGVPVTVENDANAATLGAWAEHGDGGDFVLLTLGTGVGVAWCPRAGCSAGARAPGPSSVTSAWVGIDDATAAVWGASKCGRRPRE